MQAGSAGVAFGGAASERREWKAVLVDDEVMRSLEDALRDRELAGPENPVLLMVSGGSDSTALAYLCAQLRDSGALGPLAMLHVNHKLRGAEADEDARFVAELALLLDIPLFSCEIDVGAMARREGANVEAVARRERYLAANEALASLCFHEGYPLSSGRIFTAHTADDRVETFYMRSIVGTGPGGFRSMRYRNGPVCRPLLDVSRQELRDYLEERRDRGLPMVRTTLGARGRNADAGGCEALAETMLWREDATNAHTDRFRAFVRHEIVPKARQRNPQLGRTLVRTMNLIADEDDMLEAMVDDLQERFVRWLGGEVSSGAGEGVPKDAGEDGTAGASDASEGFLLLPELGEQPIPLRRRLVDRLLQRMLGPDARVEAASVQAVLDGWAPATEGHAVNGGYVANIQGDLAVSANKHGVRVEPMAAFRTRRKRA